MAHPRRVVPGETYLITRRCSQRSFRLRPCALTNRIFTYCLAFALEKTGVVLHAACAMSDHHHLVVTDPRGLLPDFLRELHRLTAKALNASQGQWENLWSAEPCNAVRLVTDEDVLDKIAYVATNPVAAGLVERPEQWPGFKAWGTRTVHVTRPKAYFDENGVCAAQLRLEARPPEGRDGKARDWSADLARAIEEKVRAAHAKLRSEGRRFFGRATVLGASFLERARSYEEKWRTIPTFAAKTRALRERLVAIERSFRARYRRALETWRRGAREVEFPFGTWGMRVMHAVTVGPPVEG
jgi:REP element-mobilizing transposase RayT